MTQLTSQTEQPSNPPPIDYKDNPFLDFISDQVTILVPILLFFAWRKWIQPRFYKIGRSLKYSQQNIIKIRDVIVRMQVLFDADRVVLAEFTNGDATEKSKFHYWKLRIMQEVQKPGVSSIESIIGGRTIDITKIPEEIEKLLKEEVIVIERNRDLNPLCYNHLRKTGAKALLEVLITDDTDDPMGVLSIQYCSYNKTRKIRNTMDSPEYYDLIIALSSILSPDSLWKSIFNGTKKD